MKTTTTRRLLTLLLCAALLISLLVPVVSAAPAQDERTPDLAEKALAQETETESEESTVSQEPFALTDIVRVSIELDEPATLDAGFEMEGIGENAEARAYRQKLRTNQDAVTAKIEAAIHDQLDVKWNLTLLMNIISANVRYGDIETIKAIPGVKDVFLENEYEAPKDAEEGDHPNTANTSNYMVGAVETWAEGYTGAGSRIAIIDTGLDTTHQSVNADAFNYAIQQTGKTVNLFTSSDLSSIKSQLNGSGAVYVSAKIPFGYNYVDSNTTINHLSDTQGEHGSHVAGIAAANRFIKSGSSYVDAASTVHAVGMAPDAQLFIMKVFGSGGGAYDSNYMAAIEDAIVLGCDVVNLSLGSSVQGFTYTSSYQTVMNKLANPSSNSKMVVSISAGNSFDFAYFLDSSTYSQDLYIEDVHMHTGGSPGTFVNSLCVAAAENTGTVGKPLVFNGNRNVFYAESTTGSSGTAYTNPEISTVAGTYQYVYIDAPGNAADYSAVNSAVSLSGKIVIVNRGDISFYEKGNNLKSYNPKALIVANNQDGTIYMALDSYTGTFPMVSITLADANAIKAESTQKTTGSYTYYTGTVQVTSTPQAQLVSDNAEICNFSSWGAPGSLLMKPEITAPGGDIYSIWGTNKTSSGTAGGSDKYEMMSGTSMAAPHITGLTGTLAQYIRENNISISGKTTRQIAQSLLMSTAVPMHIGEQDGPYYPILQQGAGLANVHQAVHASSMIFMGSDATISYADGKVKAEIGDKPGKSGTYTYSFNIYNTANQAQTYNLSTDLFTQDRYVHEDGYARMSKSTATLPWEVTYSTGNTVTVPANGNTAITVTIHIPEDMSEFDALYPCGAYVEGFTYIESQTTSSDGAKLDVRHSIPILGFYGSWTDPSMFDTMSYVDKNVYGETQTAYSGNNATNYMTYKRSNSTKYVTGNPYTAEQPFPYEKLALRSTDTIYQIQYMLVRAAGTTGVAASKLDDAGNVTSVISASVSSTNVSAMYYNQSSSAWQSTSTGSTSINKAVSSYGSEGDHIRVGFYAIPEYNAMQVASDKTAASAGYLNSTTFQTVLKNNVLGRGAMVGYDFFIDNTAPTIVSAVKNGSTVTVQVQDNCYLAWLALVNSAGTTTYASVVPEQTAKGEMITYTFDISGLNLPSGYKVLAGDYASNETTAEPTEPAFNLTAVSNNEAWGTVSVTGNTITASPAAGYYVESCDVISGTATYTVNGNIITVSANEDCTVRVNFAPKPTYTVNFVASGNNEGSQSALVNDAITLPATVSATAEGWTFVGWMTQQIDETDVKPEYYAPGASYTVTGNTTLYAVYTHVEEGGSVVYELITAAPADWAGNYVITNNTTSTSGMYVLKGITGSSSGTNAETASNCTVFASTGITLDGTTMSNVPNDYVITLAANGSYYTVKSVGTGCYYGMNSSSYLYAYSGINTTYCNWTPGINSSGVVQLKSSANGSYPYFSWSSSNSYFWSGSSTNANVLKLYKEANGSTTYYWTDPVVAEHTHELVLTAAVAPTCGADGHSAYYQCSVCGKYFSDANGENEITLESTVIPATGNHTWGAWTSNNNGTHKHTCTVCGATEDADCTYTDVVTAPTATEQGYTTHTCTVCGYSFVDSYTAPLGNDYPVHFSVPAGVTKPADMVSNTNTGITLPTVEGPEGYTFLGWVTEDYDNVETRPATILTGNYIAPQEITLKALFSYVDGEGSGETVYQLVDSLENGGKYIIVDTNSISGTSGYGVGNTIVANNHYLAAVSITVNSDDTVTATAANLPKVLWEAAASGSSFTFYNAAVGKYMGLDSSEYLYPSATALAWAYTSEGYLDNQTDSEGYYYLSYDTTNSRYTTNKAGKVINFYQETVLGTYIYTTIIGEEHVHTPGAAVTENNVEPTCTAAGSYDTVVYCTECGEELSRETVTVAALGHEPKAAVAENNAEPTCTAAGGYDNVVYCNRCGEELSREHVTVDALGHLPGEAVQENYVEPTATVAGGYDMVVYCQRCNAELSREHTELPATMNGYFLIRPEWTVTDIDENEVFAENANNQGEYMLTTDLAEGDKIKVVHVTNGAIDAWYPNGTGNEYTVDAAHAGQKTVYFKTDYQNDWSQFGGHIWIDANTEPEPEYNGNLKLFYSFTLGEQISSVYTLTASSVNNYVDYYVVVEKPGADPVTLPKEDMAAYGTTAFRATYNGIAAKEMGVEFTATLYAVDANGKVFYGPSLNKTVQNELEVRLKNTSNSAVMRTLCADMLNYGAAAQIYFDYDTENLVNQNPEMADYMAECMTQETPTAEDHQEMTGTGGALFVSTTLGSRVSLDLKGSMPGGTNVKLKIMKEDGTVIETVDTNAVNANIVQYVFDRVGAKDMRTVYKFRFVDLDGACVDSKTLTWSVEYFVAQKLAANAEGTPTYELARAMLIYGDSAAVYLEDQN